MSIGQWEPAMVERGRGPARGGMTATTAGGTKLSVVRIILLMAGITASGSILEEIVNMATCARHIDMFACQFERCEIMVIGGRSPAGGGMTGTTVFGTKLPVVRITLLMAGITISRSIMVDVVDVAGGAGNVYVFTCQLKGRKVMVKFGWSPASRIVA